MKKSAKKKTRTKTRTPNPIASKKPGTFQPGNQAAVGNKGGGRPTDELKQIMQEIALDPNGIQWLKDALANKPCDEFLVLQTGVQVPIRVDGNLKLKILQFAADRGFGKASQTVEHTGKISLEEFVAGSYKEGNE